MRTHRAPSSRKLPRTYPASSRPRQKHQTSMLLQTQKRDCNRTAVLGT
ncbi:hypothetical protein F441_22747 [Phytophthora nicotianae CJ01A1]|uniref:Uncharacterized protein n=2 Tax=Phytophthora nicotianae TaxID=4792 RepID=V9EE90_PHYNI|nr:hypothetical protein F443_16466 [Phytophthora nicotianae P1569]ETO99830.1 hypothetical protein F441_22747 [Phytophthora nicotianae CJ01A1]